MVHKIILLAILFGVMWVANVYWVSYMQPDITTEIAMQQLEPTAEPIQQMRALRQLQLPVFSIVFVLGVLAIFWTDIKKLWDKSPTKNEQ